MLENLPKPFDYWKLNSIDDLYEDCLIDTVGKVILCRTEYRKVILFHLAPSSESDFDLMVFIGENVLKSVFMAVDIMKNLARKSGLTPKDYLKNYLSDWEPNTSPCKNTPSIAEKS